MKIEIISWISSGVLETLKLVYKSEWFLSVSHKSEWFWKDSLIEGDASYNKITQL